MFRSRSWFGSGWSKPKNRLSLEHLKYLYSVLEKHTTVSESNRGLLVESLRSIAEILIWGDQHDSSVFDFFLEKNMLSYFLHIMRQKSGGSSFVCVQLLQTLNILFENIRNETSLYYLLSNNHVNSIIVHKFDFSDEDVMGYYILFLKTLSLKLNTHTIHFFYNEHTNDFPLYTEAIKFFNHPESMVRIAVRTISLNVYRVQNASMLRFIRDKTAAPYFSNLVWFIGKHILELDACVLTDTDHQSNQKLSNLIAEHLDHLHYLNDILLLEISDLNAVLTEHLLHKLFVPLYIYSLTSTTFNLSLSARGATSVSNRNVDVETHETQNPRISSMVALYLLSLVFLVITHAPLVHALAWVILNGDNSVFKEGAAAVLNSYVNNREAVPPSFAEPPESLEQALGTSSGIGCNSDCTYDDEADEYTVHNAEEIAGLSTEASIDTTCTEACGATQINEARCEIADASIPSSANLRRNERLCNITDEEKRKLQEEKLQQKLQKDFLSLSISGRSAVEEQPCQQLRPFLRTVLSALDCAENDYLALLALCLLYAMTFNKGIQNYWFYQVLSISGHNSHNYKTELIERLLTIITISTDSNCRIRLVTIELALQLLLSFRSSSNLDDNADEGLPTSHYTDEQQDLLFSARNQAMLILRNFYRSEDIFLDLFEDEYSEMHKTQLNVEFLCMDAAILLPPTGTPLTGIAFTRRLPCGEVEKARKAIRVFFLLRKACQQFLNEKETILPLNNTISLVQVENILDLNNSDLIACTVITKDATKQRRFLVIDPLQLILVEPDAKLLGWGVAKFVGFLQDVEVGGDKDDNRCLHITVHRGGITNNRTPMLTAKFLFDDHIRCMAAKQRLTKGRSKARQKKMYQIAQMIEMPGQYADPAMYNLSGQRLIGGASTSSSISARLHRSQRSILPNMNRVPGFAAALRRDHVAGSICRTQMAQNRSIEGIRNENINRSSQKHSSTTSSSSTVRDNLCGESRSTLVSSKNLMSSRDNCHQISSRDSSPGLSRPRSEEIPLEDFQHSRNNSPRGRAPISLGTNATSRPHTPSKVINSEQLSPPRNSDKIKNSTDTPAVNNISTVKDVSVHTETSFIGARPIYEVTISDAKNKGIIETV